MAEPVAGGNMKRSVTMEDNNNVKVSFQGVDSSNSGEDLQWRKVQNRKTKKATEFADVPQANLFVHQTPVEELDRNLSVVSQDHTSGGVMVDQSKALVIYDGPFNNVSPDCLGPNRKRGLILRTLFVRNLRTTLLKSIIVLW